MMNGLSLSAMTATALTFLFVLLSFTVNTGEGIHCWVCSSDVDGRCGDPFNMTHFAITDCNRDRSQSSYLRSGGTCKKEKTRVNNELTVIRSCNWDSDYNSDGTCSPSSYASYKKVEHCSTCSTDACNGATARTPAGVLSTAAAFLGSVLILGTGL